MTNEIIARMINGGTVAIEDGTKAKEEFAPARKVKVELSFAVPEGQDGTLFLNGVTDIAQGKINELLGRKAAEKSPATATMTMAPAKAAETPKPETAAEKKARLKAEKEAAPQKTKADLAREAGVARPEDDGELIDEIHDNGTPNDPDDLGDLLGEAAPVPVTDAELGKAAQEKNAKMKTDHGDKWAPSKIRDLIAKASGGKRINDIPAADRATFLKALDALKV